MYLVKLNNNVISNRFFQVKKYILHENFSLTNYLNDIALLVLDKDLPSIELKHFFCLSNSISDKNMLINNGWIYGNFLYLIIYW